ncbi:hypothetical protein K431DRAFT_281078 [Polychaeton citri CBS 116435]|uniref:Uncharacterized protein n=1 Tax=Polychaeton citri CBS 116435 TaxID=1314669 RepID=A0A9P4UUG5_9PEZI|nr:hypothetical protein K431DRAFT_281078 [Polychaeton citri CBS 116435]
MPATTRSRARQTHMEDFQPGREDGEALPLATAASGERKRKKMKSSLVEYSDDESPRRVRKSSHASLRRDEAEVEPNSQNASTITINRAPVLELWRAVVTRLLYPQAKWETRLSAGAAISTICAISKGRAVGAIGQPDPETAEKRKEGRRKHPEIQDLDEIGVVGFDLRVRDGAALVSGKSKDANENALRKKFGDAEYDRAIKVFTDALRSWQSDREDLDAQAFGMYETFRPATKPGARGWGRKGELDLDKAKTTIRRPD